MCKFLRACLAMLLSLTVLTAQAKDTTAVKLSFEKERLNEKEVMLSIRARVDKGVRLFALQKSDSDALYSTISFDSAFTKYLSGSIHEKGKETREKDATLDAMVSFFSDSVLWQQKINLPATDSLVVKGTINYMFQKRCREMSPFPPGCPFW